MSRRAGTLGVVGVAARGLWHDRTRAVLVVLGVALAAFAVAVWRDSLLSSRGH